MLNPKVFRILSRKTASPSAERRLWVSWNARIEHAYDQIHAITSEAQLAEVVSGAEAVRPFGHRYSSADISAGSATLLDMTSYDQIVSVDEAHREITAQSGVTLKALLRRIESLGWAIPCLPDIDGVTLGGALATGTHGTGREGHILSHYMSRCRLVTAQGSVLELDEEHELMPAVRVSLGVLGVFSEITMRCVPSYTLHIKERPVPDDLWLRDLERLHAEHEFLRLLWLPHTGYGYLITGDRIDPSAPVIEDRGPSWLKRRRAASKWLYRYTWRFPRLTSFANKILFAAFFSFKKEHKGTLYGATVTKRRGSTMQLAEWSIPRRLFPEVFSELKRALNDPANRAYAHVPMDIRFLKRDQHWLSYAYNEDCVTVGCVCRDTEHASHYEAFKTIEDIFLNHGGRPHWAKQFEATRQDFERIYPKFEAFCQLRQRLDPTGKFLTPYLRELFL